MIGMGGSTCRVGFGSKAGAKVKTKQSRPGANRPGPKVRNEPLIFALATPFKVGTLPMNEWPQNIQMSFYQSIFLIRSMSGMF